MDRICLHEGAGRLFFVVGGYAGVAVGLRAALVENAELAAVVENDEVAAVVQNADPAHFGDSVGVEKGSGQTVDAVDDIAAVDAVHYMP